MSGLIIMSPHSLIFFCCCQFYHFSHLTPVISKMPRSLSIIMSYGRRIPHLPISSLGSHEA